MRLWAPPLNLLLQLAQKAKSILRILLKLLMTRAKKHLKQNLKKTVSKAAMMQ